MIQIFSGNHNRITRFLPRRDGIVEDEAIEMEKIARIQKDGIIIVNDSLSVFSFLSTGLSDDFGGNICN